MITLLNKIKNFFKGSHSREQIKKCIKELDLLEQEPIIFGKACCDQFQKLKEAENLFFNHRHNPLFESELLTLRQRILALAYRLEGVNGGLDKGKGSLKLFEQLRVALALWKQNQPIFQEKALTETDNEQLKLTANFHQFAELILKSSLLQDRFFNWIIRDQNEIPVFIQFPALVQKLMECNLTGRLSCLGKHHLKIVKEPIGEGIRAKIVTLPFEGKDFDILNENRTVTFRGQLKMTIKEIFEVFKHKELKAGNLEFMLDGIINWNIHHLGFFDAEKNGFVQIDMENPEWWKQLPLFEVLTLKQAKLRYGEFLNGRNWSAAAAASRGSPTLSYEKTHAFLELAIPIGFQKYAVYDFGKLAYQYPGNLLELLDVFCKNVHATVAFPDDNVFFSHRQQAIHAFPISEEQGIKLMQLIKEDILEARRYNFIYQIESENCAKWVNKKLEAILGSDQVPNLYRMQLLDTEPESAVMTLFKVIKKLPTNWQVPVLSFLHLFLGAFRETTVEENGQMVKKSLAKHSFFKTGEVYLPAFMHSELLAGRLKRSFKKTFFTFAVGLVAEKHRWSMLIKKSLNKQIFSFEKREEISKSLGLLSQSFLKIVSLASALSLKRNLVQLK